MAEKTRIDYSKLPKTKIFAVSPGSFVGYNGPSDIKVGDKSLHLPEIDSSFNEEKLLLSNANAVLVHDKKGEYGAFTNKSQGVVIIDLSVGNIVKKIPNSFKVAHVAFSPMSSFLLTWEKQEKSTDGSAPSPNLHLWNILGNDPIRVASFHQKTFVRENWPMLHFSDDESVSAMMVKNNIHFFDSVDWKKVSASTTSSGSLTIAKPTNKLHLERVSAFELSPGVKSFNIAAYVAGKAGGQGKVAVYKYPMFGKPTVTCNILKKVDDIDFKWSKDGKMLLAMTSSDLDTSGASYYGETFLQLLHANGDVNERVHLTKSGPIHDVQWDPLNNGFIAVAGSMPPKTALYSNKGEPIYDLGEKPRNTISWSPHGRFVAIAGFGNLAGEVDFWDRNKLKGGKALMSSTVAHCTTSYEWSPDSRFFMVGTTTPRMREGNGFQLFKYNGVLIFKEKIKDLSHVSWKPIAYETFPDRPQSPKKSSSKGNGTTNNINGNLPALPAPAKVEAYRPRHATGSLAARMRRSREGATSTKAVKITYNNSIPGAPPGSSNKNTSTVVGAAPSASTKQTKRRRNKKKTTTGDKPPSSAADSAITAPSDGVVKPVPVEKKIKQLQKKLKKIEELKKKVSSNADIELNDDQKAKLKTEDSVRQELAALKI